MKVKSESEVAQSCLTLSDPRDCSLPGSSIHGIFQARVLEWVAIAFSTTCIKTQKHYPCKQSFLLASVQFSCSVVSDSVRPHRWQPTRLARPWDSPGKNTGVGCHCLLQCMKVKSESEVAQSCLTLSDPRDCSLPGYSVHGIFQARVLEWVAIAFSEFSCLCPTLCDPMDCSMPGFPVHHQCPEFAQTHVHRVAKGWT